MIRLYLKRVEFSDTSKEIGRGSVLTFEETQYFVVKAIEQTLAQYVEKHELAGKEKINLLAQDPEYAKTVQELNEMFSNSGIYSCLTDFKAEAFKDAVSKINSWLKENKLIWPKMYIYDLALSIMDKDFQGDTKEPEVDFELNKARLITLLKNEGFKYEISTKDNSKKIFQERLIPMNEAFKKYLPGNKIDLPFEETILAGGDSTRFLKMFRLFDERLGNDSKELIEDSDLHDIYNSITDKDLKEVFPRTIKELYEILNIPMFQFLREIGKVSLPIRHYFRGKISGINREDFQKTVSTLLEESAILPKAMNYALRLTDLRRGVTSPLYLNYAWIKIIRILVESIRSRVPSGHRINLMLKDQAMVDAFQKSIGVMRGKKILKNKSFFFINLLDRAPGSIVMSDNGLLRHEDNNKLSLASAGHGTGLRKATSDIKNEGINGKGTEMSLQTIDNMGSALPKITTMLRRALRVEVGILDTLNKIVANSSEEDLLKNIKEYICGRHGYNCGEVGLDAKTLLADFVKKRWSYHIDTEMTLKEILQKMQTMPITVAMVVQPEPGHKGGGLYLQAGTNEIMIVDKFQYQSKQQEEEKNYDFRFNPMVYASYFPQPLGAESENGTLFLSKGKPVSGYNAVESASTHVATSGQTLKRIVEVPRKYLKKVFQQNKMIHETHYKYLKEISRQLQADLRYLARYAGITLKELYSALYYAQEEARNYYLNTIRTQEQANK